VRARRSGPFVVVMCSHSSALPPWPCRPTGSARRPDSTLRSTYTCVR
jgi:hypothetical protein